MRQKSILNMLNNGSPFFKNNRDNVESGLNIQIVPEEIRIGSIDQQPLFLLCHGNIRIAVFVSLSSLHLNNDEYITVLGDDVYLLMTVVPVAFQNLVAFINKVLRRKLLALFSEINVLCHKLCIIQ